MAFNSKRIFVQNSFFQAIVISIIVSTIHFKVNATNEHLDKLINNEKDENHNRNHEIDISTNNDRILAANEYKTMNSLDNDQINRHIPELSRINKRSWQNLQGSWGKRDAYGKSSIDDDIIGVDGSNSNFHGYAEPGLDEYEDLLLALSKQHQQQPYYSNQDIIDLIRTFPERSNNDDNLARNLQKRAWKNLSDGWGKRLVSKNLGHRNINGNMRFIEIMDFFHFLIFCCCTFCFRWLGKT